MTKRLVICCDGTWDTPDAVQRQQNLSTNVSRLALAVAPRDALGREQRVFYGRGIGTSAGIDPTLATFGYGLSQKILDAYVYIVENFEPGDELCLFGFSRGAYTVRSTAGLIRNAGVLRPSALHKLDEAYALYRDRSNTVAPRTREATLFRMSYSRETRIKLIGVWETVGALGVPKLLNLPAPVGKFLPLPALAGDWDFHDVTLSSYVDFAYQALALDEHRKAFAPALWAQQSDLKVPQVLEQVWFAGVHSNVGGGYLDTGLSDIALLWLMHKAQECGLAFDTQAFGDFNIRVAPRFDGTLYNSMTGLYKRLGEEPRDIPAVRLDANGAPMITNERVVSTAVDRLHTDPSYRPANLMAYVDRGGPIVPLS